MNTTEEPEQHDGTALLALAGDLPDAGMLVTLRDMHDLLVATDGVAHRLMELGMVPDVVIGDLDSILCTPDQLKEMGPRVIHDPSQETNDLEKALCWLRDNGRLDVTVVGVAGRMTDHTLNNYSVLARFAPFLRIVIREGACSGYLVHDVLHLAAHTGDRISIIPLPEATLTTEGLQWELAGEHFRFGAREGASNIASAEDVSVAVSDGVVLVMHYDCAG